jgi:hypothetical protein
MSLYLDGTLDLLALQGGRELHDEVPWHFVSVQMPEDIDITAARVWIWRNLTGRFILTSKSDSDSWTTKWTGSFEDSSEASAFAISMPILVPQYL